MTLDKFFDRLWQDYIDISPQAALIHQGFSGAGETILNDHVAFRTFNLAPIDLSNLEKPLLALGYRRLEAYDFKAKKLSAWGYVPPQADQPRVFLSELRVAELSSTSQGLIQSLVEQIDQRRGPSLESFLQGRPWALPSWQAYQTLLLESEYAAWLAVMGLRANHFTISVNELKKYREVAAVNDFVESLGLEINAAGGRVKGSPQQGLEQSATLADSLTLDFEDAGEQQVSGCYYEFAKRYAQANGELYQGFVTASADKIFQSTDRPAH